MSIPVSRLHAFLKYDIFLLRLQASRKILKNYCYLFYSVVKLMWGNLLPFGSSVSLTTAWRLPMLRKYWYVWYHIGVVVGGKVLLALHYLLLFFLLTEKPGGWFAFESSKRSAGAGISRHLQCGYQNFCFDNGQCFYFIHSLFLASAFHWRGWSQACNWH